MKAMEDLVKDDFYHSEGMERQSGGGGDSTLFLGGQNSLEKDDSRGIATGRDRNRPIGRQPVFRARTAQGPPGIDTARPMFCLGREEGKKENRDIMAVDNSGDEWELIKVNVDSGAIDTVGPKGIATAFKMRSTPASRNGLSYRAANGTPIKNEGEKHIVGLTSDWSPINFVMQIAEVSKPLGSVCQFT